MKPTLLSHLLSLCCLAVFAAAAWAQSPTTGEVTGKIADPQGAAISGAQVTLTSSSGNRRETTSDDGGRYRFALVEPGTYEVRAEVHGFKAATVAAVQVRITETIFADVHMTVAGSNEVVNVSAIPAVAEENATEGRVIGETDVNQLPLPTRNYTQLLALSPGAISSLPNNAELGRGDADINVAGQRSTSNNVILDGTEINSPGTNSTPSLSVPAPDAIEQFIVQTSMYDATQGRNSGGNVAVVTKSGTNNFHGDLYEYFRNDALNANDFFLNLAGQPRPELKRNQFGGTLGGAIIKNKTFFFVSYQGTRERNGTSPTSSLAFLNMPADLTDDRSTATLDALAGAETLAVDGVALPLSPVAEAILQARLPNGQYAIPSAANGSTSASALQTNPTAVSGVSRFTEDQFSINIDQQISSSNKLTGKFFFSNDPERQAIFSFLGANPFEVPGYGGDISFHNRVLSLADTQIISPNLVNETRFGFSRIRAISNPEEPFTNAQFGIDNNPFAAQYPGLATIEVTGLFTIGSSPLADEKSVTQTWQAQDTLSYTRGRHSLRVGGQFLRYDIDFYFHSFSRGEIVFNDFADFLSGGGPSLFAPDVTLLGAGIPDRGFRASDGNWFIQDDIHATSRLTLNAGLRIDHFGGFSEIRGRFSEFNPATFPPNPSCSVVTPCPNVFTLGTPGQQLNPSKLDVSPRVGFAWSPTEKNNWVLRGGFGMFYDRFSDRFANLQVFNYPYDVVGVGLITAGFFGAPFPSNLGSLTFPLTPQAPSTADLYFDGLNLPSNPINGFFPAPRMSTPYTMAYNLDIQASPWNTWLIDIGYVGNRGNHLLNLYNLNQGTTAAAATTTAPYSIDGFSTNKQLFGIDQVQTEAASNYNSLQASLTKRFGHGLQFLASYTYSHSIDDASANNNVGAESEIAPLPGNQQDLATQYGSSDFDRKHRFVFSGVYDLPHFYHGDAAFAKVPTRRYHGGAEGGLSILKTLLPGFQKAEAEGRIRVLLRTGAVELTHGADGAITGVIAADEHGTRTQYKGRNVVLTAGGCMRNPVLFEKYHRKTLFGRTANAYSQGQGIEMGVAAGGHVSGGEYYIAHRGAILADRQYPSPVFTNASMDSRRRQPWEIEVNSSGQRYVAEDADIDSLERAQTDQPGMAGWVVWDQEIYDKAPPLMARLPKDQQMKAFADGHPMFARADTIEELARRMDLPPGNLAATVNAYNDSVETKSDRLGRKHMPLPIAKPPFYIVETHCTGVFSHAGLDVDGQLRVLTADKRPIRNLYAAGEVIGGWQCAGDVVVNGCMVTPAITFGRLLGQRLLKI